MYYAPTLRTALAVEPNSPFLTSIRRLIGLADDTNSSSAVVTALDDAGPPLRDVEALGHARSSDIVFVLSGAEDLTLAPPLFAVGVRLHWKYLWHPRFQLWLPRTGQSAVLVPALAVSYPCFRTEGGALFADSRMPFASMADRERGIAAAHEALRSSMEG